MKKIAVILKISFVLLALIYPILSITYLYTDIFTKNMVGFLWALPSIFVFYELLKYNKLVLSQSLNVKSLEELKGIKTKIEIEILMDILQHISFVYTMLIVIIGSISLYHDERCNIIIFCICCTVILNAFTHLNLPKYKKLLLNTNGKAKCRLVKCVNNLYKKIKKVTLNKIIAAVFILFVFMIPMGMAIFITTIFIYHEEYVLTVLFLGIAIIMMISMFAAMIYYASNFSETISERNVSHLSEVVTVMAIYLYLFGNKNEK